MTLPAYAFPREDEARHPESWPAILPGGL